MNDNQTVKISDYAENVTIIVKVMNDHEWDNCCNSCK